MNIQSVRFAVPTCRLCVAACRRQRLQRECVRRYRVSSKRAEDKRGKTEYGRTASAPFGRPCCRYGYVSKIAKAAGGTCRSRLPHRERACFGGARGGLCLCGRILYGGAIRATFETGGKAVVGLAAGTEYPAVKFDLAETFHRKCLPFAFSDGLLSLKGRLKT